MSVICSKFLLKLALRTKNFLKLSHASTLSRESKLRLKSELPQQQYTVTRFDCNPTGTRNSSLANAKMYVTVQFLLCFFFYYFEFEGYFRVQAHGDCIWRGDLSEGFLHYQFVGPMYLQGLIHGGANFRNFSVLHTYHSLKSAESVVRSLQQIDNEFRQQLGSNLEASFLFPQPVALDSILNNLRRKESYNGFFYFDRKVGTRKQALKKNFKIY